MRMASNMTTAAVGAALALCAARAEAEWLPAAVELSDGTRLEGRVQLTDDCVIIHNEAQARRYTVRAAEIARLETAIERQSMEEKWFFRESGLDDKVYTGEHYPVRQYLTRITFHDGRALEGRIMPRTFYVEGGGQKQRFILRAKDEGAVGQRLEDLVYVRSIAFSAEGAGTRGTVEGTLQLPDGERLQKVVALNRDKLVAVEAQANPDAGAFRVSDCTEGVYDLVVITDKTIYVWFSRERDEGSGRLNARQVAEVQAWVDKLRDFFHTQRVVYAAGDARRTFALVCQERHGGTTLEGAGLIRRYEVWAMDKPGEEWQIEKRMFLTRTVTEQASLAPRAIVIAPALGGHVVSAASSSVQLEVTLGPGREPLIPPADTGGAPPAARAPGAAHALPAQAPQDAGKAHGN